MGGKTQTKPKETNNMNEYTHNGFKIVTDTSISGSHLAVARVPGVIGLDTKHHDTEEDALYTIISKIDNYMLREPIL